MDRKYGSKGNLGKNKLKVYMKVHEHSSTSVINGRPRAPHKARSKIAISE